MSYTPDPSVVSLIQTYINLRQVRNDLKGRLESLTGNQPDLVYFAEFVANGDVEGLRAAVTTLTNEDAEANGIIIDLADNAIQLQTVIHAVKLVGREKDEVSDKLLDNLASILTSDPTPPETPQE